MWSQYSGRSFQNKDGVLAPTNVVDWLNVEKIVQEAITMVIDLWKGYIGHRVYGDMVNVKRNIDDVIVI